jgi:hypothetical protein
LTDPQAFCDLVKDQVTAIGVIEEGKTSMKSKTTKKSQRELPGQEAPSATRDQKFWTMRIEPGAPTVIAERIAPRTMMIVIQNHGPGKVVINTGYRDEVGEILPGRVRLMSINDKIHVETIDEKSALLEFEFMPTLK